MIAIHVVATVRFVIDLNKLVFAKSDIILRIGSTPEMMNIHSCIQGNQKEYYF